MTELLTQDETVTVEPVVSPGEQLKSARQRAGWTPERLAGELCLSPDRLRALEADDHSGFGGVVFVRGYLRRAASVLGLPPSELIAAYEAWFGAPKPADILPELPPGRPSRLRSTGWLGAASGLAVVFLAIVATWWLVKPAGAPEFLAESRFVAVEAPQHTAPASVPEETASAVSSGEDSAATLEATEALVAGLAGGARVDQPETSAETPESGSPGNEMRQQALAVTVDLSLDFSEDCWVEVRDARGTRLAYRLYRSGDSARLQGVAPLDVFLGNVRGVRLAADGAPLAVRSASRRDGTARLKVGGGTG